MTGSGMPASSALSEWVTLSEALTRGLVHAFNNRFTALSAYAELAAMGDEEFAPAHILPAELLRLQSLNHQLRLLVIDATTPESMEPGSVLDDAVALLAHHPRARTLPCEIVRTASLPPVRAPRWALLRLLMVMIEEARRSAETDGGDHVTLRIGADGDALLVAIDAPLTGYTAAMASVCHADVSIDAGGVRVRFPSLAALRRRDAAARSSGDDD